MAAHNNDEDLNGYRLIKLLDEATNTLKEFLLKSYKNDVVKFTQALKCVEVKIRKTLRPNQIKIVFPDEGETRLENYDICLIYSLLRILQKIRRPKTGWYDLPLVTDKSEGACVVRIYLSRNSLCHGRLSKTSAEFQKYLDDIGESMLMLGCDVKIINDIIKMTSVKHVRQIVLDKEDEMRKLEDENEELLQQLEKMESCYGKDIWFGVMPLIPTFVGRVKEVGSLHEIMLKLKQGILATVLSGLPGTGKTTLAQYYCYEYSSVYENNVVWLNSSTRENLNSSFLNLARHLNLIDKKSDPHSLDVEILVTKIYRFFSKTKVLFVFDNCENVTDISNFLPNNLPPSFNMPSILITSQKSNWGQRFLEKKMNKLLAKESIELITNTIPRDLIDNTDVITQLATLLDGYPLALQQSTAYIKHFSISVSEYIERFHAFDASSQSMFKFPSDDTMYQRQLSTSLEMLLNSLYESNELSSEVMKMISLLDGTKIEACLFHNYLIKKGDFNESVLLHLERLSLIRLETNHIQRIRLISVHSLVQRFIKGSLKVSNTLDIYIEKVFSLFKYIIPIDQRRNIGDLNYGNLWSHHIIHLYNNLQHNALFLEKISEIKREITDALRQRGNENIAIEMLLSIQSYYIEEYGEVNYYVLDTLTLLQGCYSSMEKWEEALPYCSRGEKMALELFKEENNTNVSIARHNRALCLSKIGQRDEAIDIYKKLFAAKKTSSTYTVGTAITAINLSSELERQSKYNEALDIEDQVLSILEKFPSYKSNIEYYEVCEKKADTLSGLGRHNDAEDLMNIVINECSIHLGNENLKTLQLKRCFAFILMAKSKYDLALSILLEALNVIKERFDENHYIYLGLQQTLAACYHRMGRLAESVATNEIIKRILEQTLDVGDEELQILQYGMARCYFSLGQYSKALNILFNIRDIDLDLYEENHPKLLETQKNIAYYLYMVGDYHEAMKMRREIKKCLISMHGETNVNVYEQTNFIAMCLEKIGHFDEALEMLEYVYEYCHRVYGSNFFLTVGSAVNRAICWLASGNIGQAFDFFLKNEKYSSDHADLGSFFAKYYLLSTYVELGRISDALKMLEVTLQLGNKLFGSNHVFILRVHYQMARCDYHNEDIIQAKSKCDFILTNVAELHRTNLLVVGTNVLLAQCLFSAGMKDDSTRLCHEIIECTKNVFIDNHPILNPAYNILTKL